MQPANGALCHGQGVIVLHELCGDTVFSEGPDAVAFGKETTLIAEASGRDDAEAGERSLFYSEGQALHLIVSNYSCSKAIIMLRSRE